MIKSLASIGVFLLVQVSHAQKKFTTQIQFPASIDTRKILIEIDDGQSVNWISHPVFNKNKITLTGTFSGRKATLSIQYLYKATRFHQNDYFLNEGHSSLVFSECRKGDLLAFPFDSCKLSNAVEVRKLPEAKELALLTAAENLRIEEIGSIEDDYASKGDDSKQDSLMNIYKVQELLLLRKQLAFMQQNNHSYYSLWLFRRAFTGFTFVEQFTDTLTRLFASFPADLRNSFEGQWIQKKMHGALYVKKGYKAPGFNGRSGAGVPIDLGNYKGKYVLLQFWASWCGPCLEEIPFIKKLRTTYSDKKLAIISVSIDSDRTAFLKAVEKHHMNWITILDNKRIIHSLYGGRPIPSVYLIDKAGMIVYSNWEEDLHIVDSLLSR